MRLFLGTGGGFVTPDEDMTKEAERDLWTAAKEDRLPGVSWCAITSSGR